MVGFENSSKAATKKKRIKVQFNKNHLILSYCTLFWFKTEILAYEFFDQSENSLCKPEAFHKWTYYAKNLLLWSTCFRHFWVFCWGSERTWNGIVLCSVLGQKKLKFQGVSPCTCAVQELVRCHRLRRWIFNSQIGLLENHLRTWYLTWYIFNP